MSAGIVLVHGFSGSPETLMPLTRELVAAHGREAVASVCLPGHGAGSTPSFEQTSFIKAVTDAVIRYQREGRTIVLLGHSTGGILALAALSELAVPPALLILASVPKRIDAAYLDRWTRQRSGMNEISFTSLSNMISLINAVGSKRVTGAFPVLLLHGADDDLVPVQQVDQWELESFEFPVRSVIIPRAGHGLFQDANNGFAIDVILRAVADQIGPIGPGGEQTLATLSLVEPEAVRFLKHSPSSRRHIAGCPSGHAVGGLPASLDLLVDREPVFANIEITTRCNLHCAYCARTILGRQGTDMTPETFSRLLGLLPHAYRITLVGLGETLLHPRIVEFVAQASSQGRRVAIVTNGMVLDKNLSRQLLDAGLDSIAFSIDGSNQDAASEVRPGTDFARVIENIKGFIKLSNAGRSISTAVFTAVSRKTVPYLEELINVVTGLGVHVLMLSDLNFRQNTADTLWKNADEQVASMVRRGVARGFKNKLPVLSVRGLEEFGLWKRYEKFLLLPPDQLYQRSNKRAWCFSPWQTVPVSVTGEVTLCDCRPEVSLGNLLDRPLGDIWNGKVMQEHRQRMLGPDPPEDCRICPRF